MGPAPQFGLHPPTVGRIAREVKALHELKVEICMVIGGGNIFARPAGAALRDGADGRPYGHAPRR